MTGEQSAALVVRVWLEGGTDAFRARVTAVAADAPGEDHTIAVASSPREVTAAVGHWLEQFLGHAPVTD